MDISEVSEDEFVPSRDDLGLLLVDAQIHAAYSAKPQVRSNSFCSRAMENCPLGVTRNCPLLENGQAEPATPS
jgi:hypothetical protein